MIIDFHTHIFPDKIAERAVAGLIKSCNDNYEETGVKVKNHNEATLNSLKEYMENSGIDMAVVLPIATKPSQFESINTFAAEVNKDDMLISFGSIHPLSDNITEKLDYIKSLGLKGIKLHPDYQGTYIDTPEFKRVVKYAADIGLITVMHAGVDGAYKEIHCPPDKAGIMIDEIDCSEVVLAHTGGFKCWEGVLEHIAGKNVYLDISFTLPYIDESLFLKIAEKHGVEKLLYATDSPWGDAKADIEHLKKLGFSKNELDMIFYKNAKQLLQL